MVTRAPHLLFEPAAFPFATYFWTREFILLQTILLLHLITDKIAIQNDCFPITRTGRQGRRRDGRVQRFVPERRVLCVACGLPLAIVSFEC